MIDTTYRIRSFLALVALALIVTACGASGESRAPGQPFPSSPASPSPQPSEQPTAEPSTSPEPVGILTIADGINPGGPGRSLAEAIAGDVSQPVFVRGVLFRTSDGTVYLADSLVDDTVPTFSELRVLVENFPTDGPTWDMADAGVTGLQEVNGIRFFPEGNPFYGTIRGL